MTCIFTGCRIRLSHEDKVYSSDAHAVGEAVVFVRAREPINDREADVVINANDQYHYWERSDDGALVIVTAPPAFEHTSEKFNKAIDGYFERWFASMPPDEVVELDRYEPDHERKCEVCGNSPTVVGIKDNQRVLDLGLCGPCTWGEAKALDPETWNQ